MRKDDKRSVAARDAQAKSPMSGGSLDASQAAREFGGSESFYRRRMDLGELPYVRAGKKRLIPRDALLAYFERRLVPAKDAVA